MYEKIKSLFDRTRNRYILIGALIVLFCICAGYILYQPSGADYHRAVDAVERAQEQQRESLESELDKAKADSVKQKATLNEMQNSLDVLKNKIERDNRTIKRLWMQRNISQVVGAGATIGVVIRR